MIFVCLGSPKQEVFSYELSKRLKKPQVVIPVGAAFDFISNHKSQASLFIQKLGFEWLFRLLKEPKRLFASYLFYGLLFTILIFKQKITKPNYKE